MNIFRRLLASGYCDIARPTLNKLRIPTTCFLLAAAIGCAGLGLPKAVTQEGITKQRRQRNDEARQLFDRQRDSAEYEQARSQWVQQHDAGGCRRILENLLARNPRHRDARLLMVELSLAQGDAQTARDHAKAALDLYPNDAQVHFSMARVMEAFGQTSDALGYYERATKMDPQNRDLQVAYQAARESARRQVRDRHSSPIGRPQPAADGRAAAASGSSGEVLPVGYAASSDSANRSDSAGGADSAANADDDRVLDLLHAGQTALAEGDVETARDYFHQAIAAKPDDPQVPVSASVASLRANRPDLAVELLSPAAKRFPASAAVHRALGAAYYRGGDYKSSQVALRQALSLDKSSPLSYLLMGCTLAKLGQKEAAESHLRQARALDPRYNVSR